MITGRAILVALFSSFDSLDRRNSSGFESMENLTRSRIQFNEELRGQAGGL